MNSTKYIAPKGPKGDHLLLGTEYWVNDYNKYHREDGPAVTLTNNNGVRWYSNGELHRVGGPAVESWDGREEWHYRGRLHRVGGPAITTPMGGGFYYLDDEHLTEKEYWITLIKRGFVKNDNTEALAGII